MIYIYSNGQQKYTSKINWFEKSRKVRNCFAIYYTAECNEEDRFQLFRCDLKILFRDLYLKRLKYIVTFYTHDYIYKPLH